MATPYFTGNKNNTCAADGHRWNVGKFGGVRCGRCSASSGVFSMLNGKPLVAGLATDYS